MDWLLKSILVTGYAGVRVLRMNFVDKL
jgi:hypothetical protein